MFGTAEVLQALDPTYDQTPRLVTHKVQIVQNEGNSREGTKVAIAIRPETRSPALNLAALVQRCAPTTWPRLPELCTLECGTPFLSTFHHFPKVTTVD